MTVPGFLHYPSEFAVGVGPTPKGSPRWYAWLMFASQSKVIRVRIVAAPHRQIKLFVKGALTAANMTALNAALQAQKVLADTCTLTLET